jgi:protein TonB
VIVIGVLLYVLRAPRLREAFEPTGVSVVYDTGESKAQTPRMAPVPAPSQAPPPAPPPAATATAPAQPEVNLNLPESPIAALPLPQPQSLPQSAPNRRPTPRHERPQKYIVMNDMSVNSAPAPENQFANKALNLNIGGADELPANTPEISIQGQIGTDWQAGFNKWVYAHLYYPDAAREQNQQGAVTISFTVHRDGSVTGVHLLNGSGSPFLDQAWMGIFLHNSVPPFPPHNPSDTIKITATVNYVLQP